MFSQSDQEGSNRLDEDCDYYEEDDFENEGSNLANENDDNLF